MLKFISFLFILFFQFKSYAQNPIGKWKVISEINEWQGDKFDSHEALLSQCPCAAKIFYVIHTDGTYRLDASQSTCDERDKKIRERLYSASVWTIAGNIITIGYKKAPSLGHKYIFTISGNKMIWVGTDGQGTITYQKV